MSSEDSIHNRMLRYAYEAASSNIDEVGNKGVGAVLVGNNGVVYTGCRHTFLNHKGILHKTMHAEQMVIMEAGEYAQGGTLYVTMEPCLKRWHHENNWHYSSCCELIVQAGIRYVYIGSYDKEFGAGGAEFLASRGVKVYKNINVEFDSLTANACIHESVIRCSRPE